MPVLGFYFYFNAADASGERRGMSTCIRENPGNSGALELARYILLEISFTLVSRRDANERGD